MGAPPRAPRAIDQEAERIVPASNESTKHARGTILTPPCRACALHTPATPTPLFMQMTQQTQVRGSITEHVFPISEQARQTKMSSPGSCRARRRAFMVLAATGALLGVWEGCNRVRAGVRACAVAPACKPSCAPAGVVRCTVPVRPRVLTDAGVTGPLFARATHPRAPCLRASVWLHSFRRGAPVRGAVGV